MAIFRINLSRYIEPNLILEQQLSIARLPSHNCRRVLATANRALRPAAWLRSMADRYIDQFIGGSRKFLCMHVRPFGDKCLDVSVS